MASHTSVIVNHRVALPGSSAHGAVATHRLDYVRTRLGAVREPTDDDIRRWDMLRRQDALGYVSHRHGAVPDRERNCSLFDAGGVADYRSTKADLVSAEGAILTSVVTVRREDAEELGLQTKQDFERFLRANWPEHLERLGISPQDARWVAAFHTNSDRNFHAHVISWDDSGSFNSLIPKRNLEDARRELVSRAIAPARQKVNTARTQARDGLASDIRRGDLSEGQRRKMQQVIDRLPANGSLRYGSLTKKNGQLKAEIDALVRQRIKESPQLSRKAMNYERAVERHADLKGLKGAERQAYVAAAMDDLEARLGNAQLARAKQEAGIGSVPRQRKAKPVALPEGTRVVSPVERKREQVVAQELGSCLTREEKNELADALAVGGKMPARLTDKLASLPSAKQYAGRREGSGGNLREKIGRRIARMGEALSKKAGQNKGGGKGHLGKNDARCSAGPERLSLRALAAQIVKAVSSSSPVETPSAAQELMNTIKIKR